MSFDTANLTPDGRGAPTVPVYATRVNMSTEEFEDRRAAGPIIARFAAGLDAELDRHESFGHDPAAIQVLEQISHLSGVAFETLANAMDSFAGECAKVRFSGLNISSDTLARCALVVARNKATPWHGSRADDPHG